VKEATQVPLAAQVEGAVPEGEVQRLRELREPPCRHGVRAGAGAGVGFRVGGRDVDGREVERLVAAVSGEV
jgi:hypothetical protein